MRSKIAIILAILGLLMLAAGIGQRTVWLPPATLTAATPADVSAAPLTVISPELLKTRGGQFTLTIKSDGPIQLAVARERDIIGWVGDAAYTQVQGANDDFTELNAQSKAGSATVPNPAGSDMWVSEEKASGELSYTWQSPGHGDWALLLSSDGTKAAPTNISMTVENKLGTPWAVPLMLLGSAMLAGAAILFFIASRKPKNAVLAPIGRRAAGKIPADPATGALEVDKLVAAREAAAAKAADTPSHGDPATIADASDVAGTVGSVPGPDEAKRAVGEDPTSALPAILKPTPVRRDAVQHDRSGSEEDVDSSKDSDNEDDRGEGGRGSGGDPSAKSVTDSKEANTPRWKGEEATKDDGKKGRADFSASPAAALPALGAVSKTMKNKKGWGAALAVIMVAGGVGPAVANESTAPVTSPATAPAATSSAPDTNGAANTAGFPNLLDSQVQRIATAVAAAVASGDNAKNAKELESRVAGMALQVRAANYQIRSKVPKEDAPEGVNATQLLAKAVTTTEDWPRSAIFLTKGENNELPQLLTLVQRSPRENYKLIKATPLLPGQTFPIVDKEGTKEVAMGQSDGLTMSPTDAIAALSDRLTKTDSKFKDSFNDSVYITSVLAAQKKILVDAKDATNTFTHTANLESTVAMHTADGGALVVVGYVFGIDATSNEDATLTVPADAAVFTGGTTTTTGFTLSYAEPVVMYIPPASSKGKITLISATRDLIGGKFK